MIFLEFTIGGPPMSAQARNREALREWKEIIRRTAKKAWKGRKRMPTGGARLEVYITYYYDRTSPDIDNFSKPVLDALEGVVYENDRHVVKLHASKLDINGTFRVRNMSAALAWAFHRGSDFIHVRITDTVDLEVLP